jgi:MFS family permease
MTEQTIQSSDFKDRKTGLVVFGIILIIFGGFCALMVPFMIFSIIASTVLESSSSAPMNVGMMIFTVLFYVGLAVWFIWMGIGSIKARRWARALLLVTSWMWFIGGLIGLIFMLFFMSDMYNQMGKSGQLPQEMVVFIKYMMIAFMAVFYVIIPGIIILFYRSKNVKATCEFRDSQIRWTDKCPLPVLAASLMFGFWAVSMLFMGFYGWVFPFFGFILSGMTGAGIALVSMLLFGYAAWGTYKLDIKAWWCSVLLIVAWALSTIITFSRVSLWDFYEKMNLPEEQLAIMKQYNTFEGSTMIWFCGFWFVGFLGYLLYTKRYFISSSKQESVSNENLNLI